jgi:hypothetical protein
MPPSKSKGLGVTQEGAPTRWKATGYVEGIGWLEGWGTSLVTALEALQALARHGVAEAFEVVEDPDEAS